MLHTQMHTEAVARFVALQTILYPDASAVRWFAPVERKPAKAKAAKPKPDARAAFFAEVMRWGGAGTGDPLVTLPAAWCREARVAGVVIKSPRAIHVPAGMPLPANVELAPPPPARKSDAEWEAVVEQCRVVEWARTWAKLERARAERRSSLEHTRAIRAHLATRRLP